MIIAVLILRRQGWRSRATLAGLSERRGSRVHMGGGSGNWESGDFLLQGGGLDFIQELREVTEVDTKVTERLREVD